MVWRGRGRIHTRNIAKGMKRDMKKRMEGGRDEHQTTRLQRLSCLMLLRRDQFLKVTTALAAPGRGEVLGPLLSTLGSLQSQALTSLRHLKLWPACLVWVCTSKAFAERS
jgi:hypothetical protein